MSQQQHAVDRKISREGITMLPGLTYSRICIVAVDEHGYADFSNEVSPDHWTLVKEEGWSNGGPTVALYRGGLFYQRENITTDCFETELYRSLAHQVEESYRRLLHGWHAAEALSHVG
jgi:hypothetical protein